MSNLVTNACRPLALDRPAQKAVLMCLADRANDEGIAWPSVPWICEWTCLGRTAAMDAVKWLEAAGLLVVHREHGRNNRITLLLDAIAAHNQSASRTGPPSGLVRVVDGYPSGSRTGVVRLPDGGSPPAGPETPIHQKDTKNTDATGKPALPACPHEDLMDLYRKHLPELPQPRRSLWAGKNADAMRARWRWALTARQDGGERYATTAQEALGFFDRFFTHVAKSDFLTGRSGKWGGCHLGWLMNADNFAKVVQGIYDNKEAAAPVRTPLLAAAA